MPAQIVANAIGLCYEMEAPKATDVEVVLLKLIIHEGIRGVLIGKAGGYTQARDILRLDYNLAISFTQ